MFGKNAAFGKKTKEQVHYRRGTDKKHCAICTMFRAPDDCTAVTGPIQKTGVCDIFEKKS